MKILFFGDVVGKVGRRAVAKVLPEFKAKYQPDIIIANAENIAHGTGITEKTLGELRAAGVDIFTSGNHIFKKPEAEKLLQDASWLLLRPANFPAGSAGRGFLTVTIGAHQLTVINLMGQVFINDPLTNPFLALDEILAKLNPEKSGPIIVDFHAEATSEKIAFGWYADGRVAAVVGTHTHVPTADTKILPHGTAYVSDIGMVGATDSVIGVKKENVIKNFLGITGNPFEIPEQGSVAVGVVLIEIDTAAARATKITRLDTVVEV